MSRKISTAIPLDDHRTTPLPALAEYAGALRGTGAVDFVYLWDELSTWFPKELWTPKNSPAADFVDGGALYDPFIEAGYIAAKNPDIGLRLSTDSLRSGPAELLRRLLTLANATSGPVVCAIGAGEARQTKPFGYKRAEGLKRLEDTLALVRKLYDAQEPISYEGHFWNYTNAFMGDARPAIRPEFWALGGGPTLLEIAAKHADGFEAAVPQAITNPDKFAQLVRSLREKVEANGRDPQKFGMGIWLVCATHDDPDVLDVVLDNPLIKYFAACNGRVDGKNWAEVGITPVMPEGWNYPTHWLPAEHPAAEIRDIVARTSNELVRKSFYCGTPDYLTGVCREYIDAGADFVSIADMTPMVLGPADGAASIQRAVKTFQALKS